MLAAAYPERVLHACRGASLSARQFNESVVDGLAAAGDESLRAVLADDVDHGESTELSGLKAERALCTARLDELGRRVVNLLARLEATTPDGAPMVDGALLRRLNDDFNDLIDNQVPDCEAQLTRIDSEVSELVARRPDHVGVSAVLHLAASLRDLYDVTYRQLWQRVISNLRFEVVKDETGEESIGWHGWLRLGDSDHEVLIPFSGRHPIGTTRRRRGSEVDVTQWLKALGEGTPFAAIRLRGRKKARQLVAEHLGVTEDHTLFVIEDPRILRTACALLRNTGASNEYLAADLDEPVGFVARIRDALVEDRKSWRIRERAIHTTLHALASGGQPVSAAAAQQLSGSSSLGNVYNIAGELRRGDPRWSTQRKRGYRFECACGSHAAAPLEIPEPVGAVCLECRRDAAGLVWPTDPYDGYVAHPELWAAHGFEFATD